MIKGIYLSENLSSNKEKYSFVWRGFENGQYNIISSDNLPINHEWINQNSVTKRSRNSYSLYFHKNLNYETIYIVICGITTVWIRMDTKKEAEQYISKIIGSKLLIFNNDYTKQI